MVRTIFLVVSFLLCLGLGVMPRPVAAQSGPTYPIVDTGQSACYNNSSAITCPGKGAAFYGQDAQHSGNQPGYTDHGDGTVTDTITGLMWQQSPDTDGDSDIDAADKLTYSAAGSYCATLSLGGYADWRLPDIKTLYSLIDFSGTDPSGPDSTNLVPFIDTTVFEFAYGDTAAGERIIDAQYASSTLYVSNTANDGGSTMFGVNFADGRIKGYGLTMPGSSSQKTFFVMCVRGNASYGQNSFSDNGDGTITDSATGLMWAQADSGGAFNWEDALAWVAQKNSETYLGHNDWRLPNAKELQSIVDYSRSPDTTNSAALDPVFSASSITNEDDQTDWPWYWASTTHATANGMGANAVYLAFGRAGGWQKSPPTASCYSLLDVHGAGAQRSDPKSSAGLSVIGTACSGGTAYGLGPQGDAQRGANFVRLVRDDATSTDTGTIPILLYLPVVVK